jgi:hypothetical protein
VANGAGYASKLAVSGPGLNGRFKDKQCIELIIIIHIIREARSTPQKTLSLSYPRTGKLRGVKSGDRGGQAIALLRLIQATTMRLRVEVTSRDGSSRVPNLV